MHEISIVINGWFLFENVLNIANEGWCNILIHWSLNLTDQQRAHEIHQSHDILNLQVKRLEKPSVDLLVCIYKARHLSFSELNSTESTESI